MAIKDAGENAKKELVALTGFKSPSLIGASKSDKGVGWVFSIEVVEKTSIPDGMDILGLYEVVTDANGGISKYERKSTRKRMDRVGEESEAE